MNYILNTRKKRQQFVESIKVGKTNDARTEKQTKVDRFDKNAEREYISDVLSYYQTCIHNCERTTVDESLKRKQIKNIKKENERISTISHIWSDRCFSKA